MRECQEREWNTNSICVGKEKKKRTRLKEGVFNDLENTV